MKGGLLTQPIFRILNITCKKDNLFLEKEDGRDGLLLLHQDPSAVIFSSIIFSMYVALPDLHNLMALWPEWDCFAEVCFEFQRLRIQDQDREGQADRWIFGEQNRQHRLMEPGKLPKWLKSQNFLYHSHGIYQWD